MPDLLIQDLIIDWPLFRHQKSVLLGIIDDTDNVDTVEANPDMSTTDMIKLLSGEDQPKALVAPNQLANHLPVQVATVERLM